MNLIIEILIFSILTGCLSSFWVVLLRKWGVSEWLQTHGNDFLYELASCQFCQNWWLAWAFILPVVLWSGHWHLLVVPFFSTTIGRLLSA